MEAALDALFDLEEYTERLSIRYEQLSLMPEERGYKQVGSLAPLVVDREHFEMFFTAFEPVWRELEQYLSIDELGALLALKNKGYQFQANCSVFYDRFTVYTNLLSTDLLGLIQFGELDSDAALKWFDKIKESFAEIAELLKSYLLSGSSESLVSALMRQSAVLEDNFNALKTLVNHYDEKFYFVEERAELLGELEAIILLEESQCEAA